MAYPPPGPGYPPGNVSGYPPSNMSGYPPSNAPGYPPQPGSYPPGNTTVSPCTFCSTFSASIKVANYVPKILSNPWLSIHRVWLSSVFSVHSEEASNTFISCVMYLVVDVV